MPGTNEPRTVVMVGGGISGLATAYRLHRGPAGSEGPARSEGSAGAEGTPGPGGSAGLEGSAGSEASVRVVLLEAAERLGGKVATAEVAGLRVDVGPDALLARSPLVRALLVELGLATHVQRAEPLGAYVWTRGVLRRLPPGSLFGVPERLLPLLRSGLLGPWGTLRAAADLVLPRLRTGPDPSIAELLRPRFGRPVFDRLIDPMLGGVHAGRAEALSARSAVPEVHALVSRHRSAYLALRQRRAGSAGGGARPGGNAGPGPNPEGSPGSGHHLVPGGPAAGTLPADLGLVTLDGGLGELTAALHRGLAGADVRTGTVVRGLHRSGAGYRLTLENGNTIDADAVVLATPAAVSADLLRALSPAAAAALDGIPTVGVATVTMAFPRSAVARPLDATGFLVPPAEGRFLVGCSWLTQKWPYLHRDDLVVLRCMVGRHGDQRWSELDDATLVARVRAELAEALGGLQGEPRQVRIARWPRAMPQYTVGHADRLAALDVALAAIPGIIATGAAYRGVGLSGCLVQAEACAQVVRGHLDAPPPPGRALPVTVASASVQARS